MSQKNGDEAVLSLLQNHRSIRKFKQDPLAEEELQQIILSAQMASTSSHLQAYSIIGVTEPSLKKELADCAGNQLHVETCAHFLVFCADLYRLKEAAALADTDISHSLTYTELFMVATTDATLAAQNAAISAEALGLGIVYIGGLRNQPERVSQLLGLPHLVYPVFGMCLGYPDQQPEKKPRLPMEAIYHQNRYQLNQKEHLAQFDQAMSSYYTRRTNGSRTDTWSKQIAETLKEPRRTHMKSFLEKRGFSLQ